MAMDMTQRLHSQRCMGCEQPISVVRARFRAQTLKAQKARDHMGLRGTEKFLCVDASILRGAT
jgi:hypothetical protein